MDNKTPMTTSEIVETVLEMEYSGTWEERMMAAIYLDRAERGHSLKEAWRAGELAGTRNQRDYRLYQDGGISESEYERRLRPNPYVNNS